MSQKSIRKRQLQILDPGDTASRIRELRTGLGLLQSQFADRLGVSRTQVVAWEGASSPRPSTDHLLQMARFATDKDSQLWFLERAGVDIGHFGDAFSASLREHVELESEAFFRLPIITKPDDLKSAATGNPATPTLAWRVSSLEHPGSTFALRPSLGSNVPDPEISFVVVDASPCDAWTLIEKWVAVYFDSFAVHETCSITVSRSLTATGGHYTKIGKSVTVETSLETAGSVSAELNGFFVGRLRVETLETSLKPVTQAPWYVGLELYDLKNSIYRTEPISALSHDEPNACALGKHLRPGCRVFGEVIGWTR